MAVGFLGGVRIEPEAQLHVEARAPEEPEKGEPAREAPTANEWMSDPGRERHDPFQTLDLARIRLLGGWRAHKDCAQSRDRQPCDERYQRGERTDLGERQDVARTPEEGERIEPVTH